MLGSGLMDDFVALHMTWGTANELSTLTSYHRLIARTEHPQLVALLNAIIKDERRHFAFCRAQARLRLARSPMARRMTRWAMDHLWAIVGTGVRPQAETDFVVVHLFGNGQGREAALEMDRTIGELPGPAGQRDLPTCATGGAGPGDAHPGSGAGDVGGRPRVGLRRDGSWSPPVCP
jgi:hypothetical protein